MADQGALHNASPAGTESSQQYSVPDAERSHRPATDFGTVTPPLLPASQTVCRAGLTWCASYIRTICDEAETCHLPDIERTVIRNALSAIDNFATVPSFASTRRYPSPESRNLAEFAISTLRVVMPAALDERRMQGLSQQDVIDSPSAPTPVARHAQTFLDIMSSLVNGTFEQRSLHDAETQAMNFLRDRRAMRDTAMEMMRDGVDLGLLELDTCFHSSPASDTETTAAPQESRDPSASAHEGSVPTQRHQAM